MNRFNDKEVVLYNMQRLGVCLSDKMKNLAMKAKTPKKIFRFLQEKGYEPNSVLHNPESAKNEKKLHCFDGAFLGYTLGLLNGIDVRLVYLEGIADNDHMIVVFKEKGKYGAISQSSNPYLAWREAEFDSIKDLIISFRRVYSKGKSPRFSDMVGYSEEMDEIFFRDNIGFDWMSSDKSYRELFHILTNKLKYRLLEDIETGIDRQFSHPLIISLQQGWIKMTDGGNYSVAPENLSLEAKILYYKFYKLSNELKPTMNDLKARQIMWEFFRITGTTPEDLKNMASYMSGWFQKDGFKQEQLLA